jgi:hypothetical protein
MGYARFCQKDSAYPFTAVVGVPGPVKRWDDARE